ncbi:hypothetical protein [Streptomyces sp. CBMA152]|uniref:hypothetical protein n=1 Tax=Streptomyces sp. CBMA152 TaxID=1896312 RepID=UPI0016607862|nr:hypothetical protein [Streptomyces sp. CBMA152]MBD0747578.1 hypothetical protein [Streptomyces sp. CBMA152]
MSYWDADAQRWVEGPSGQEGFGEPWQPPPDDSLRRMLIVVFVAVLLCGAAGTGIWWLARDQGGGHHPSAPPWPPSGFTTDTPTDIPTNFPDTTEPTTQERAATDEPTTNTSPSSAGPEATVTTYYGALNRGDYSTAWDLGGKNLGQGYSSYVSGFSDTRRTDVTVLSTAGDTVYVNITAYQRDDTRRTYSGTYTVRDGVITDASVHQTS